MILICIIYDVLEYGAMQLGALKIIRPHANKGNKGADKGWSIDKSTISRYIKFPVKDSNKFLNDMTKETLPFNFSLRGL
jgi:hypothetical protein